MNNGDVIRTFLEPSFTEFHASSCLVTQGRPSNRSRSNVHRRHLYRSPRIARGACYQLKDRSVTPHPRSARKWRKTLDRPDKSDRPHCATNRSFFAATPATRMKLRATPQPEPEAPERTDSSADAPSRSTFSRSELPSKCQHRRLSTCTRSNRPRASCAHDDTCHAHITHGLAHGCVIHDL